MRGIQGILLSALARRCYITDFYDLKGSSIMLQDIDPNNTVNIGGARCLFGCNISLLILYVRPVLIRIILLVQVCMIEKLIC